jgi:hypothetical protein
MRHSIKPTQADEEDIADWPEKNNTIDPTLMVHPLNLEKDIIECELVSESSSETRSPSPTPGANRREKFRIKDSLTGAEKARWQRLIEGVTFDYIHMGPEPILPGGDGHRQNLDHRKLRRVIETHRKAFLGTDSKLEESQIFTVKRLH